MIRRRLRALLCLTLLWALPARAHDPLLDLPEPMSVPEAWDVINSSVANIARLLETGQLREVAFQVANCSPAIRRLQSSLPGGAEGEARRAEFQQMFGLGANVIEATRERVDPLSRGREAYEPYRLAWDTIRKHYPPAELNSAVYVCPMHPLDRHLEKDARCSACNMSLVRRRIPASVTYEKPGAQSMKLTAAPDRPIEAGKPARVIVKLTRISDGAPVREQDLIVMHTERIHLLIVDRSLLDYHHEHPRPTDEENRPGEYAFTFTPRKPGSYRVWADVVPGETSVQEFVVADIPAAGEGEPLTDRATKLTDEVDGLRFELAFDTKGKAIQLGQESRGRITVTSANGQPFRQLQPVMGAYAHLVGFAEDYRTIVHLHPLGNEPKLDADRGGPTLDFRFYPPVAGFVRFYAQVNVGGQMKFARFGVNVSP